MDVDITFQLTEERPNACTKEYISQSNVRRHVFDVPPEKLHLPALLASALAG